MRANRSRRASGSQNMGTNEEPTGGQEGHQGCAKWGTRKDKRASEKRLADTNKRDTCGTGDNRR